MSKELSNNVDGALISPHAVLKETGLEFVGDIGEEEFMSVGSFLANVNERSNWAIGDWYNSIEAKCGRYNREDGKKAACKNVGLNYNTAKKYGGVAGEFKMDKRLSRLSFSKYIELATDALDDATRQHLLIKAEKENLTVKQLKALLPGYVAPVEPSSDLDEIIAEASKNVPAKAKPKVKKAIKTVVKNLEADFVKQVEKQVELQVKPLRENLKEAKDGYETTNERLMDSIARVPTLMTREEFRLVRACLHPDKHPGKDQVKYNKAFEIFNRLLTQLDAATMKEWSKGNGN